MIFDHSLDTISPDDQAQLTLGGNVSITGTVTGISFNSITALSSTTPVVDGVGAVGVSTTVARSDHVHPARSTIVVDQGTAAAPSISFTGATDTGIYGTTTSVDITAQGKRVATFYHENVGASTDNARFAFESGAAASLSAVRVIADGTGRPIGVYAHGDSFVSLGSTDGDVAFTAYRGPGAPQYISSYCYTGGTDFEVVAPGFNAGLNLITAGSGTASGLQVFAFDGTAYRRQFAVRPLVAMTGTQNSFLVSSANPAGSPVIGVEGGDANINIDLLTKGTGSIRFNGTTTTIASTGKLTTTASTATVAGLTLPHGTAPTTPVNGDLWTTTADMFYRLNGVTHTVARLASPTFTGTVGAAAITATGIVQGTRFTSTIATGTAPLTVTSTTRVANLNVATAGTADVWTTARTLTIGATGKSVNGSANVAWTTAEIGAVGQTSATGSAILPTGTTAQRDVSPVDGYTRFNTTLQALETYTTTGTQWLVAGSQTGTVLDQTFSGTNSQTAFTLSAAPGSLGLVEVFISGVRQSPTTNYSVTGTTLTFVVAPPAGTNNIFVRWTTTIASTVGSLTGDLTLTGSSLRIKGDFSNATPATRTAIQTTTVNGATIVGALPAGTSTTSEFRAYNNAVPTNASYLGLEALSTETRLESGRDGSGAYLPLAVYTNGVESFHVNTTGELTGLDVDALNGGQLAGLRNKMINGKMEITQRGTTFAGLAANTFLMDRWQFGGSTTAVITGSQQTDVPADNEFQASLRLAVTTADASLATTDFADIGQKIEGYNARDLIGRDFTLSFRVRSSKTGVHCVSFRNSGADRSYVMEYTVSVANTWETKRLTVPGGLITAGTWNWTTGIGLRVNWALAAGTTFQTTANAWQTGSFVGTANQVNCLDTIGNIFAITGVQLEIGDFATPFEHRPVGIEEMLCQRYYINLTKSQAPILVSATSTGLFLALSHPTSMRVGPTVSTNITDANFSTSGAPPANTWGVQVIGISVATKSGTMTVTVTADVDKSSMYIYGGTFTGAYNVLSPGSGIFITGSAEL